VEPLLSKDKEVEDTNKMLSEVCPAGTKAEQRTADDYYNVRAFANKADCYYATDSTCVR